MRLREEHKLKEKVEFRLDTRHVIALIAWSIVFSGAIFYFGLFVGEKGGPQSTGLVSSSSALANTSDPLSIGPTTAQIPVMKAVSNLSVHPEHLPKLDKVLSAIDALRFEEIEKRREEDKRFKALKQLEWFGVQVVSDEERTILEQERLELARLEAQRKGQVDPSLVGGKTPDEATRNAPAPDLKAQKARLEAAEMARLEAEQKARQDALDKARLAEAEKRALAEKKEAKAQKSSYIAARRKDAEANGKTPAQPKITQKTYTVQAKAFPIKKDALKFRDYLTRSLSNSNHTVYLMPVNIPEKGGTWYRVRIGRFKTRNAAEKFKERFEAKEGLNTFIAEL